MPTTTKKGRPKGSKTEQKPVIESRLSRCPICGSSERTPYVAKREMPYKGTSPDGRLCNVVIWRHTTCVQCGQARIDKTFELRGES